MINKRQKTILLTALRAGELMLKSGAEIYRVEDTITRICRACGIPYVECFATTTGIFLSIDSGNSEDDTYTYIKRINRISIDLGKISKINEFSRTFTTTDMTLAEGAEKLEDIGKIKPYNLPLYLLACIIIGAPLCLSFGGTGTDSIICALITVLAHLASRVINNLHLNTFIAIFLSCAVCTLLSVFAIESGIAQTLSPVIIGAITMFLPGVAITNSARDLLSGDMISGVARMAEAMINAIAIAGGVGVVLKFWSMAGGGFPEDNIFKYPAYMYFIFGFLTSLGFCIHFHVPVKQMFYASLAGAFGFCLYEYSTLYEGYSTVLACLLSAGLVAVLAEVFSRAGKDAATLFIIPGIVPLVPGTGMYTTMAYIMQNDFANAAISGSQTLFMAGAIAIAIVITASLCRVIMAVVRPKSK